MKKELHHAGRAPFAAARLIVLLLAFLIAAAMPLAISEKTHAAASPFEESLLRFPASYRSKLRALHSRHPNWRFEPVPIDDNWQTVVARETSPENTNLISNKSPVAWIKKYTVYDGGGWVAASKDLVEYYLDPRNFLDERYVFQFEKLTFDSSTQTEGGVRTIFGSNKGLLALAPSVMKAAREANVSAYLLASRMRQEIATSTSSTGIVNSARGVLCLTHLPKTAGGTSPCFTNSTHVGPRYYNLYNIGATPNPGVLNGARINAIRYSAGKTTDSATRAKYGLPWTSQEKAAIGGAKFIANSYIARGQDTMYFQKFAVVGPLSGRYTHQYMQNLQAAASEGRRYHEGYQASGALNNAFTFRIPVYRGMYATTEDVPVATPSRANARALPGYAGQTLRVRTGVTYRVRSRPSTLGLALGSVTGSRTFTIKKAVTGQRTEYGNLWYQISYNGQTGYIVTDLNGQSIQ